MNAVSIPVYSATGRRDRSPKHGTWKIIDVPTLARRVVNLFSWTELWCTSCSTRFASFGNLFVLLIMYHHTYKRWPGIDRVFAMYLEVFLSSRSYIRYTGRHMYLVVIQIVKRCHSPSLTQPHLQLLIEILLTRRFWNIFFSNHYISFYIFSNLWSMLWVGWSWFMAFLVGFKTIIITCFSNPQNECGNHTRLSLSEAIIILVYASLWRFYFPRNRYRERVRWLRGLDGDDDFTNVTSSAAATTTNDENNNPAWLDQTHIHATVKVNRFVY